ncbi:ferrous iron transport protein B [Bacillus sp. AGMB 02131]|uniref:Ferrous iron transport protein B n=1 Tax=Peribacillus faecalis TaxID=2772559 RepID=A0A927CZE2_9BACI|nr:ferrous iron transport protein B [Peribacillus faecalis]MBD3108149.1 ferrous iron transport protein B [Peribacillus faecalis]
MSGLAIIGRPNTGKTSLFNLLTDSYEYVGNWSGVTVEKKVGHIKKMQLNLIDLPGIYDFNPISKDESVVSKFLLEEKTKGIINIIDAAQFTSNMQLTLQILELKQPTVICLNMIDVAKKAGLAIDTKKLSDILGVKVIPTIARVGKDKEVLCNALNESLSEKNEYFRINYSADVEDSIQQMEALMGHIEDEKRRWAAIQLLSGNSAVEDFLRSDCHFNEMLQVRANLENARKLSAQEVFYNERQFYIEEISKQVVSKSGESENKTDKIDRILTHPVLGIPIFLLLMYIVFEITFTWVGAPLSDLLDGFIGGVLIEYTASFLAAIGASGFISDLICDGIIGGVGGILVFFPQIFALFFCISLLEDSGYMARIAVIMDRIMEFFGLNGKAFIPMIISFGCNVPGIMAARTIEQPKERMLTILVAPFMSCSARLPVYALFAGAFFTQHQSLIVLSLYVIGLVMALIVTKILSVTLLKKENSVFFVDLPEYHLPLMKSLWRSTWEKGKGFLQKAGTIIFAGSVIVWLLAYVGPQGINVEMDHSFLAMIGGWFGTLFAPLGFGTWQAGSSLISGFMAKEVVVSTMAIIYGVNENSLPVAMSEHFTALSAYTFMLFILLYIPCLATVGTIKKELQSAKLTSFAVIYPFLIAYVLAFFVYQIGSMFM